MSGPVRVAVLDYGAANMVSITKALAAVGADPVVAAEPAAMAGAIAVVVPGVGAAGSAMEHLRRQGLVEPLRDWVRAGRPCLGICLGYQIMFEASDEYDVETLGLLAGRTAPLVDAPTLPHIGWNAVDLVGSYPLFAGVKDGSYFYFVHSFAPVPADESIVLARTTHGRPFVSAVASGSLYGVQFHPEKSSDAGLRVLSNFVDLAMSAASLGPASSAGGGATASSGAAGGEVA
jgi:imidazole glycerol-phosphate synthase subunit HisH